MSLHLAPLNIEMLTEESSEVIGSSNRNKNSNSISSDDDDGKNDRSSNNNGNSNSTFCTLHATKAAWRGRVQ
eukprot:375564-Amphidinium_carterae.1